MPTNSKQNLEYFISHVLQPSTYFINRADDILEAEVRQSNLQSMLAESVAFQRDQLEMYEGEDLYVRSLMDPSHKAEQIKQLRGYLPWPDMASKYLYFREGNLIYEALNNGGVIPPERLETRAEMRQRKRTMLALKRYRINLETIINETPERPKLEDIPSHLLHRMAAYDFRFARPGLPRSATVSMMQAWEWIGQSFRLYDDKYSYSDHFIHQLYVAMIGKYLLNKNVTIHDGNEVNVPLWRLLLDSLCSDNYQLLLKSRFDAFYENLGGENSVVAKFSKKLFGKAISRALADLRRCKTEIDTGGPSVSSYGNTKEYITMVWHAIAMQHDIGYCNTFFYGIHDNNLTKNMSSSGFVGWEETIYKNSQCFCWLTMDADNTDWPRYYKYLLGENCHNVFSELWRQTVREERSDVRRYYFRLKNSHTLFGYLRLIHRLFQNKEILESPHNCLVAYLAAEAAFMHHFASKGIWARETTGFGFRDAPFAYILRLLDELQSTGRPRLVLGPPRQGQWAFNIEYKEDSFFKIINGHSPFQLHVEIDEGNKIIDDTSLEGKNDYRNLIKLFQWMTNDDSLKISFLYKCKNKKIELREEMVGNKYAYSEM